MLFTLVLGAQRIHLYIEKGAQVPSSLLILLEAGMTDNTLQRKLCRQDCGGILHQSLQFQIGKLFSVLSVT